VKSYVKRGKTDAIDAEAICEAGSRPTMRLQHGMSILNPTVAADMAFSTHFMAFETVC
jgi:transposase